MTKDEQIKEWVRQIVNYHHEDIPKSRNVLVICNKGEYDSWVKEFRTYGFQMCSYFGLPINFFDASTISNYHLYNEYHVSDVACVKGQWFNVSFITQNDKLWMSRDKQRPNRSDRFCLAEGLDLLECQSWQVVELTENKSGD